jgi:type I restriction enzyme S subunit
MEKLKNIPTLRFPEFNGEWELKKLSELAEKRIAKNRDNKIRNVFTNSAVKGIVNQRDFFDKDIANQNNLSGYYIVEHNDFVYNPRISTSAPVGPISRNKLHSGIMSPLYSVFRFNIGHNDFVEYFFNTTKWHKHMEDISNYGARDDRMSFSVGDFYKMPIPLPNMEEQIKIASFLLAVDNKLQNLKKKKNLLEQYKKGVMQKIFSQELRFKNDNGNEYPNWEDKKLADVLIKNSMKNKNQEFKLVQSVSNKRGFVNQVEYFEDRIIASKDLSNYYVIQKGDFAYNPSRIDVGSLAYKFDDYTSVISPLYISFKAVGDSLVDAFLLEWFNTQQFTRQMNSSFEGSVRNTLSYESLRKIDITFPCLEEQTKISNFLSAIDDKINHCKVQIEKTDVWKKGLLQQMFC